jgi:predicted ATP-grasp superfamily ATP-dependent carboligase
LQWLSLSNNPATKARRCELSSNGPCFPDAIVYRLRQVMRALVLGSNAVLVFNVVQALGAVGSGTGAGIEADVLSDWRAPRARMSRYCRRYVRVPRGTLTSFAPPFVAELERYRTQHAIDVIIPTDLATILAVAKLGETTLPFFPVAPVGVLNTLHDKWLFYQTLCRLGLPSPRTRLLEPGVAETELDLSCPVMVKPRASEGSEGVARFDSFEALAAIRSKPAQRDRSWLVQEFIPGRDIDMSVLADHGRVVAFTIQIDRGHGVRQFMVDERVRSVGEAIVAGTGFHGLAHFDMRIDDRNGALHVIECNPRVWGSLLASVWGGVNFMHFGCQLALGRPLPDFVPIAEEIHDQGVAPRRMLQALLRGRTSPPGMQGGTLASWRQAHADPLPYLIGNLTEEGEHRWRTAQAARAARVRRV